MRWLRHGTVADPPGEEERFWAKVDRRDDDECWPWLAGINQYGYGQYAHGGNRKNGAHRYSYMLNRGPIPEGLQVNHVCHDRDLDCPGGVGCLHRRCVNPSHLELATVKEQAVRASITNTQTHCKRGHEFTPDNVYVYATGSRTCRRCVLDRTS